MSKNIEKAIAYITRTRAGRSELLVFEHRDFPEAGLQVPAGTVAAHETPAVAVLREIEEESGLAISEGHRFLGRFEWLRKDRGELHFRNVFHFHIAETRDEWLHQVAGDGDDRAMVFRYFWMAPEQARVSLAVDQGAYLHLLGH